MAREELPPLGRKIRRAVLYYRGAERAERSAQPLGLHMLRNHCADHRYAVEKTFIDYDEGYTLDRPGLASMQSYALRTRPDLVLVKDWNHLGKREVDRARIVQTLAAVGVQVESVNAVGDPRLTWPSDAPRGPMRASRPAQPVNGGPVPTATAIPAQKTGTKPTLDYVPLTGPVPAGHQRGETFIHEDVRITPELAQQFLAVNAEFNRQSSPDLERQMAGEMEAGEWDGKSPEGMVFDNQGRLIDGQTRCRAIILSGHDGLIVDVHHNYDPEVFAKLNRGRKRTTAHTLHSAGFGSANHVAACVNLLERYRACFATPPVPYTEWRKMKLSSQRVVDIAKATPDIVTCLQLTGPLANLVKMTKTVGAVGYYLIREAAGRDQKLLDKAEEFLAGVLDPVDAGAGRTDPRTALHRNITRAKLNGVKKSHSEQLGLWLRAWEMFVKGEQTNALSWQDGRSDMPRVYMPGRVRRGK